VSERSRVLSVLECLLWVALVVIALGAALLISLLVDIDCNGLWGDRPDDSCMNRKSWTAVLPLAVLAGLAAIRVRIHQRSRPTGRREARGGDR
jgi:hypothetical protein